jgi:hypothetical protein
MAFTGFALTTEYVSKNENITEKITTFLLIKPPFLQIFASQVYINRL